MRVRFVAMCLAAGVLACGGVTRADESDPFQRTVLRHTHVLERSFFVPAPWWIQGESADEEGSFPYWFEARIAPHLALYTNLDDLGAEAGSAFAVVFTPRIDLRMRRAVSNPVLAPSYRPRLDLQWIRQRVSERQDGTSDVHRFVTHFILAHHSNGQSGCTFEGEVRDPETNRCIDTALVADPPRPNHDDGSFSVNEIGVGFAWVFMPSVVDGVAPYAYSADVSWTFHLPNPKTGGFQGALYDEYGWSRVRVRLEHERACKEPLPAGKLLFAFQADAFPGAGPGSPAGSLMALAARTFDVLAGWGPFVRFFFGRDDYNIWFDRRITTLSLGVLWNPG